MIKAAPGPVSLASMLTEIDKLTAIGSFSLPEGLFRDVAPRVLKEWRDQAMTESPSHMRDHPDDLQVALLAAPPTTGPASVTCTTPAAGT